MPVDIVMPQLGLTMTEGKVLRWYKQVGETFEAGEPLLEVETDKVNVDVEATEAGTLVAAVPAQDEPVPVTTVIGRYVRPGEDVAAIVEPPLQPQRTELSKDSSPTFTEVRPVAAKAVSDPSGGRFGERVPVSPRARAAAQRLGIDLRGLRGTGPGGRIVEEDVLRASESRTPPPEGDRVVSMVPITQVPHPEPLSLSKLRRITAERMTESFHSAPHFYVSREIDVFQLLDLKRTLATALDERDQPKPTLTDFLLKALALALRAHPAANASWRQGEVRPHPCVAVGLAVALEEGLVVPILRDVDRLPITEVARQRHGLVGRARTGRLRQDDVGEASATLSNLGMYGVDQFQAILNPPESVIVATGRVRDRVVALNGAPTVRPTMFATVSADHRVLDGALAARFLDTCAKALESPALLLLPPEVKP